MTILHHQTPIVNTLFPGEQPGQIRPSSSTDVKKPLGSGRPDEEKELIYVVVTLISSPTVEIFLPAKK